MLTVDFNNIDIYQVIKEHYHDERVQTILNSLPIEEREILEYRIGTTQDKLTRETIANMKQVSVEEIRNLEARGLRSLKHPARIQMLNAVLDPNFKLSAQAEEFFSSSNKKM